MRRPLSCTGNPSLNHDLIVDGVIHPSHSTELRVHSPHQERKPSSQQRSLENSPSAQSPTWNLPTSPNWSNHTWKRPSQPSKPKILSKSKNSIPENGGSRPPITGIIVQQRKLSKEFLESNQI